MTTINIQFSASRSNHIERLASSIGIGLLVWANSRAGQVGFRDEHERQMQRVQVAAGIREREHAALLGMRRPL